MKYGNKNGSASFRCQVAQSRRGLPPSDRGEAEALALAYSQEAATPILLDDERARRVARDAGLFVIGSAGILGRAKEAGLIPSIRLPLADLQPAGLYLGDGPMQRLLELAGER